MMKTMRVMCLQCEQVVDFDIGSAWCLFHFDHKLGPCTGVYEWRALTKGEAFRDAIAHMIDWRAFFIMFISGAPIILCNQLVLGFKPDMTAVVICLSLTFYFFVAYIFGRMKR